jgi:hypothetical protein
MNVKLRKVTALTGMPAIFIRGYMIAFDDGERSLRKCQDAGRTLVEELGATISIPYISKISRMLEDAEVLVKSKAGRSYIVGSNDNLEDFREFLDTHPDYGTRLKGTAEQDEQRGKALDHLKEHGAILASYDEDQMLPSAAFKMLMQMVKEQKLDLAFIKRDAVAGVKHNGTTHRITALN